MSSTTGPSLESRIEVVSADYQKLQTELSTTIEGRQKLEAQLAENEQVQKEFASLKPSNTVYKLIGPVLVEQDQAEAKSNVKKRLEYIRGEIKRVEAQLQDLSEKVETRKAEIVQLQTVRQNQLQQPPAQSGAAA